MPIFRSIRKRFPHSKGRHMDCRIPWRDRPPPLYCFGLRDSKFLPKLSATLQWSYAYCAFGSSRILKTDTPSILSRGVALHRPHPSYWLQLPIICFGYSQDRVATVPRLYLSSAEWPWEKQSFQNLSYQIHSAKAPGCTELSFPLESILLCLAWHLEDTLLL